MTAAIIAAVALAAPVPTAPGHWQRLGANVASRPGKQVHFFRTATYPDGLGIVARSSSSQLIRVSWWSYCEFESDDGYTEEHEQTVTGRRQVVAYPPVFDGATRCYISVTARVGPRAAVAAAVFAR